MNGQAGWCLHQDTSLGLVTESRDSGRVLLALFSPYLFPSRL